MQLRVLKNQINKQRANQVRCSKTAKMLNLFAGVVAADLHSRSVWAREGITSMRPFVGALARSTHRVTVASVKLPFGETGATIQIFMRIPNNLNQQQVPTQISYEVSMAWAMRMNDVDSTASQHSMIPVAYQLT